MAIRPNQRSYTLSGSNATEFGNNIVGVSQVLTPTNNSTTDNAAHLILITNNSATSYSAATFTIYGQGANGNWQSEEISGPGASTTTQSTLYYSSLTQINTSVTTSTNSFDLGITGDSAELQTIAFDWRAPRPRIVIVPGDITGYSLQFTISKIQEVDKNSWIWEEAVASQPNVYEFANTATTPYACRVMINEYSDGDSITIQYAQAAR